MIARWRAWRAGASERRLRRQLRRESRVYCEGETISYPLLGDGFSCYCGFDPDWPESPECAAAKAERENYAAKCANAGIAP